MNDPWLIAAAVAAIVVSVPLAYFFRKKLRHRRQADALRRFPDVRTAAEERFFAAAAGSGKPRGLRWKECQFHEGEVFAIDRVSGALYALVGVTVSFEAVEGEGMEDVEAVGNLRAATAVFVLKGSEWTTQGRVVFNLLPDETLARYKETLEPYS